MAIMKITALEAKQISEESDAHFQELLDYIGSEIKKEAGRGLRFLILEDTNHSKIKELYKQEMFSHRPKYMATKINTALTTVGYIVRDEMFDIKVGGGLGDTEPSRQEKVTKTVVRW